jgi:3-oxoacyl-[acyl-carrier protein] reductase
MAGLRDLDGRVVLYTGAAGGLGLETTLKLMQRGASVVAVDNDPAKVAALEAQAAKVGAGRLIVSTADLSDLEGFRAVLTDLLARVGAFDVVINNAAIYPSRPFEDYSIEDHQAVQRVNVDAAIVAVQAALPPCAPGALAGSSTSPASPCRARGRTCRRTWRRRGRCSA